MTGRRVTVVVLIIAVVALVAAYFWLYKEQDDVQRSRPPAVVNVIPAITHTLQDRIELVGDARSLSAIHVVAEVAGSVSRIHFEEGQRVEQGDMMVQLDDRIARANLAEQQANRQRAFQDLERAKQLVSRRAISQSEVDSFATTLQAAEGALQRARANLDDHTIRAPFAGVVGLRQIDPGSYLTPGTMITTLDDVTAMDVDFRIPERYLTRMSRGLEVTAFSESWPGRSFSGEVIQLDSRVDGASRSLGGRARLVSDESMPLRQGQFLRVMVTLDERDATLVPEQAIITQGAQSFVFTVNDDSTAKRHPVTLGGQRDGWIEIRNGLDAPIEVIVNGHGRLGNGDAVNVVDDPEALLPRQRALLEQHQPAEALGSVDEATMGDGV